MLKLKAAVSTLFLLAGAHAQAGVIDLGTMMGGANIYTLHNFSATGSSVDGALLAGGNVSISNYSINDKNRDAYGASGYAVVAGNNLSLAGGSIKNGSAYVGGTATLANTVTPPASGVKPIDFAESAAYYSALSLGLSGVAGTGAVSTQYSGVKVSGSGKGGVDVFNVSGDVFRDASYWNLDKLVAGQTLIFNVSGSKVTFRDGGISFDPLAGYNVLFNFFEASDLNIKGVIGSVLAPKATVSAASGAVTGQVVVDNWASGIAVKSGNYFTATELSNFNLVSREALVDVPEPGTVALMLAGLGMLGLTARRRKAAPGARR